jgi:hypothetical protein
MVEKLSDLRIPEKPAAVEILAGVMLRCARRAGA